EREDAARGVRSAADAHDDGHLQRPDAHPMDRKAGALALGAAIVLSLLPPALEGQQPGSYDVGTFSILGYDPDTGELGAAVQSRVFSVGNGVLWAEAGVGVAATQAIVDVSYGPQALALLREGKKPDEIVKTILDRDRDPGYAGQAWPKAGRQFAVMNPKGEYAAYTGPQAPQWAGNRGGKFCTAQGNILAGEAVVANMVKNFEETKGALSLRLVAALEGGQAGGGDTRGQQSAALIVVKKDCGVWLHNDTVLRLQVDDNPEPIKELRRLVEKSVASSSGARRARPGCEGVNGGPKLRASSCPVPVASYQSPVASCQFPVTSCQLPVASCQLPVASYRLPVASPPAFSFSFWVLPSGCVRSRPRPRRTPAPSTAT